MRSLEIINTSATPSEAIPDRVIDVSEEHHGAEALQEAKGIAELIGLNRTAVYEAATSVAELATNLFLHTKEGGAIELRELNADGRIGLEVI